MYFNGVLDCNIPFHIPYRSTTLPSGPLRRLDKRLLLRPGSPMRQQTLIKRRRTPCSYSPFFFLSSSGLCSRYHICTCAHTRLHGTCTHAYGASGPTLSQTPMPLSLHVPTDRPHPPPPPLASPVTTSHSPRWPACAVPRWPLRRKRETARDQPRVEDHAPFNKDASIILESCRFYPVPCRGAPLAQARRVTRPGLPSALPLM